jgi:hypothetical protein
MQEKHTAFLVITDLRSIALTAAIDIAKKTAFSREEIKLVVSERLIDSTDYGDILPLWYKRLKLYILEQFFDCIVVPKSSKTFLQEADNLGIKSSLYSITYDSIASKESYPELYDKLVESSKGAIEVFQFIDSQMVSKVFVYNGRLASSYPIVRRCNERNINVNYFDYFPLASPNTSFYKISYYLYPFSIHNQPSIGSALVDYYHICSIPQSSLQIQGEQWKKDKLSNRFVKRYKESTSRKSEVVVFLGSDHEYAFISSSVAGGVAIGNLRLVEEVIETYANKKSIAVRAHPNQIKDKNYEVTLAPIEKLCDDNNIVIYSPHSGISSYELIKNAEIVAIDCSSIGIDAIFLEKDVHIFGNPALKTIINSAPQSVKQDKKVLADYVSQVLSLQNKFPYVESFNIIESVILFSLARLEGYLSVIDRKLRAFFEKLNN